jgi:thiazole synthase ThiGH ThiG subunit
MNTVTAEAMKLAVQAGRLAYEAGADAEAAVRLGELAAGRRGAMADLAGFGRFWPGFRKF